MGISELKHKNWNLEFNIGLTAEQSSCSAGWETTKEKMSE